jgi:hypothetical protein
MARSASGLRSKHVCSPGEASQESFFFSRVSHLNVHNLYNNPSLVPCAVRGVPLLLWKLLHPLSHLSRAHVHKWCTSVPIIGKHRCQCCAPLLALKRRIFALTSRRSSMAWLWSVCMSVHSFFFLDSSIHSRAHMRMLYTCTNCCLICTHESAFVRYYYVMRIAISYG